MVKLAYVETPFPQEKIEVRRGEGVYTGWVKHFFFFLGRRDSNTSRSAVVALLLVIRLFPGCSSLSS